ncbi:MAG: hypothetical protein AB1630_05055 [bacterium]
MKGSAFITIIFLLLLMVASIIGAIYVLDKVGVFNKEEVIYPKLATIPGIGKFFTPKKIPFEVIKKEEIRNLKESVDKRFEEISEKEEKLKEKEERLEEKEKDVAFREDALLKKQSALEERIKVYEDEEKRWQKLALYYSSMSPDQAAKILQDLDDQTVISIFMRMKDSAVAVCLMKMDTKRAAELSRKMTGR